MIEGDFRKKVKTPEEVRALIGPPPRTEKVIMCHGVFDVVHPGHIRHLVYARSKAAILVASLTSDIHIEKAHFRPYVPEALRALNLAALEVVDYVIVDPNPTPLESLRVIQPDYFAKGYEYVDGGVHPKTREEMEVLESYGGEVLFTPGDIVYSSSKLIESSPPNLSTEKLLILMDAEGLGFGDLRAALDKSQGTRVHVVGDTIVDSHTYCDLIGSNAKTPTFSVRYESRADFVGGAAVVAKHLRAAGAEVVFSTVLGEDARRNLVLDDLERSGVDCRAIVDPTRPTTHKNVFITGGYRLLKVDTLDNRAISDRILSRLRQQIAETSTDAVVFSDFRHGIFDRRSTPELLSSAPGSAYRVADSQVASRWGNILDFAGVDLITPNEREARFTLGDQDSVVRPLASELYRKARCKTLILKLGERGILVYRDRPQDDVRSFFVLDSFADHVADPVGCGDALLAYATLPMITTRSEVLAGILGSLAAAVECERDGNVPVTPDDIRRKLADVERRATFS